MIINSTRLGSWTCQEQDLIVFPEGLIGFESLTLWTIAQEPPLAWLQSVEDPDIALPTASPFLIDADYEVKLDRLDRDALFAAGLETPLVLAVVSRGKLHWTMNLRSPILICLEQRVGRQVISASEQPLRHVLPNTGDTRRKSA